MKSDSPPSTLRFSDFMSPPCIFASTETPSEVAIMAPDSARTASPPAIVHRTTANDGLCLTWTPMRLPSAWGCGRLHVPPAGWTAAPKCATIRGVRYTVEHYRAVEADERPLGVAYVPTGKIDEIEAHDPPAAAAIALSE